MPLELPNLDDRTYTDLVAEALSLLPGYAPDWTNYNPSDPGITLVELFAYLSEMMIYRLNRVTNANKQAFLNLINGLEWKQQHPELLDEKTLNEEIRKAVLALRQSDRAITGQDFENLTLKIPQVARARCLPNRNLELGRPSQSYPGHISVVILPKPGQQSEQGTSLPQPDPSLINQVKAYLDQRRLLTTQVHVVSPRYLQIDVRLTLVLLADAVETTVRIEAEKALRNSFAPLSQNSNRKAWPFGRNVYVSEIYELLDQVPGVDYVTKTSDPNNPSKTVDEIMLHFNEVKRYRRDNKDNLITVEVEDDELIDLTHIELQMLLPSSTLLTNHQNGG